MKRRDVSLVSDYDLFRFDVRSIDFIEKNGFPADIGPDSINAESSEKVFFSKGKKGILDLIDVWLIWRMNRDFFKTDNWRCEFLSGDFLLDYEKQKITFDNMFNWLQERRYYHIELSEGVDYLNDDIDEAKKSVIDDKNHGSDDRYLFAKQMYAGKTDNFDDLKVKP